MPNQEAFDFDAFVTEISERVAQIHNHPFHQHMIAILAIETKLYHVAQSYKDAHGITIVNNMAQECINPALKICHRATQNVLKIRKLLGLSRGNSGRSL